MKKITLLLLLLALAAVACSPTESVPAETGTSQAEPTPTLAPTSETTTQDADLYQPGSIVVNCFREGEFEFRVEGNIAGIPSLPTDAFYSITIDFNDGSSFTVNSSNVNYTNEYLPTTVVGSVLYQDGSHDPIPTADITCPLAD